jgi:hypothetical protein
MPLIELSVEEKGRDFLVEQNNIDYYEFIWIINRNVCLLKGELIFLFW